jgi:hypothetical protein
VGGGGASPACKRGKMGAWVVMVLAVCEGGGWWSPPPFARKEGGAWVVVTLAVRVVMALTVCEGGVVVVVTAAICEREGRWCVGGGTGRLRERGGGGNRCSLRKRGKLVGG